MRVVHRLLLNRATISNEELKKNIYIYSIYYRREIEESEKRANRTGPLYMTLICEETKKWNA